MTKEPAILALADGTIFEGRSIGASGQTNGEIVFNTSMTGYQEILTDPSYAKQIVTLTYPHIGNTGTNDEDLESDNIWCSGLVIRSLSPIESNWRKTNSLSEYLKQNNIIGISDIDTRKLTRIIRTKGAQSASIFAGNEIDEKSAILNANQFGGLSGMDLAKVVTTPKNYMWDQGRNFAVEHDILFATASQLNRSAVEEIEFDHSHISGGLSKIQTADNVIGIFTSQAMRERGRYQVQFMKTRSSAGVGQKVDLAFDVSGLRITDLEDDDQPTPQSETNALYDRIKRKTMSDTDTNPNVPAVENIGSDRLKSILKKQD